MQSPGSQTAVYEFQYTIPVDAVGNVGVRRGCHSNVRTTTSTPDVPVLDRVEFPDGSHDARRADHLQAESHEAVISEFPLGTLPAGARSARFRRCCRPRHSGRGRSDR